MRQKEAAGEILHLMEVMKRGGSWPALWDVVPMSHFLHTVRDRNSGPSSSICLIDHSLKLHAKVLKLSPLLSKNELLTIIVLLYINLGNIMFTHRLFIFVIFIFLLRLITVVLLFCFAFMYIVYLFLSCFSMIFAPCRAKSIKLNFEHLYNT